MSEVLGNGVTAYVWTIDGSITQYVRESVVDVNAADKTVFDARETAAASVAGYQTVDFGGSISAGTDLVGKADGTYTASISIDGTAYAISVDLLLATTDFDALITALNADLPGTEAALSGGNIVVTSSTTGNDSKVVITDTDIFTGATGFVEIDAAVDGDLKTDLMSQTLSNGKTAYATYNQAVESYDSAGDKAVLDGAYAVGDLNAVFSDTEVEAELAAVKAKLDVLQSVVSAGIKGHE